MDHVTQLALIVFFFFFFRTRFCKVPLLILTLTEFNLNVEIYHITLK